MNEKEMNLNKIKMLASMAIFGTLSIFVTQIDLPSSVIACARAWLGTIFILLAYLLRRKKIDFAAIKKNIILLLCSGTMLGFNWVMLFQAYKFTGVGVATICYYMAPVMIMLLSPVFFKEKLTGVKLTCILAAVAGTVLCSVVGAGKVSGAGIALGLGAASCYCAIMIINKFLKDINGLESTLCQLAVSAIVMLVYVLVTEDVSALVFSPKSLIFLAIVGIVHTGVAYILFFGAANKLKSQTAALMTYIDPALTLILAALVLRQPMSALQIIGAVLMLGATLAGELSGGKKNA